MDFLLWSKHILMEEFRYMSPLWPLANGLEYTNGAYLRKIPKTSHGKFLMVFLAWTVHTLHEKNAGHVTTVS